MNNKKIIGIIAVIAFIIGIIVFATRSSAPSTETQTMGENQNVQSPSTQNTPTQTSGYTMADVSSHNSQSSCWTTVNGSVYDVTSWINKHPGGSEAILSLCGKDGTAAFTAQHGGQGQPEKMLASFKIGTLNK